MIEKNYIEHRDLGDEHEANQPPPVVLKVTDDVRHMAETVVLKYNSDQARFPKLAGTSFVNTAAEFTWFLEEVREANPNLSEALGLFNLRSGKDNRFADAVMDIINDAAKTLRDKGKKIPPIPDLFDREQQGQARSGRK